MTITAPLPLPLGDRNAPGLDLPEPFASAEVGAEVEYSHRKVGWTLYGPGDIHRNRYEIAWVEIREDRPWRGEPLYLSATRRPPGTSYSRVSFTDKARDQLHAELVPVVARYGFTRLWSELHAAKATAVRDRSAAAEARRIARWWDTKGDLAEMERDGVLEFRPLRVEPYDRTPRQRMPAQNPSGMTWEEVTAEALHDGHRVGWVTRTGVVIPDGSILEEPR
jgi:hypothetical protein